MTLLTRRGLSLALTLVLSMAASGCAGDYIARTAGVRAAYETYNHDKAVSRLDGIKSPEIDRLLVLLDKGMILHSAGKFEESIKVLAQADKLSAELDLVSVSEEAHTLISSERERVYRGEDFEKLMISVLQALNYAKLGMDDDALVEIRRVNERIRKMINDEKKPYEQLAIARYLGGVMYEDQGELDSAFIDYYDAYKIQKELSPNAAEPLLRLAKQTDRDAIYEQLKVKFPEVKVEPLGRDEGQIVVIIEMGRAPEKIPQSRNLDGSAQAQLIQVPMFRSRWWGATAMVQVGDEAQKASLVTSLDQISRIHLNDRIGKILAKQVAGMVVKAGLGAGVAALTKSEALGALTFIALSASNLPDLRSWMSLPAEFQIARFRARPGKHTVTVSVKGNASTHEVEVKRGRIGLLVLRRF